MGVFVISECGSSWRFGEDHLSNAYRMIEEAKECGADAVKFQWCSSAKELTTRRGEPQYEKDYEYVVYDPAWLPLLKAKADEVGIEWMCTAFLPQDVEVIAPLVKRFKVAAKEANDEELRFQIMRFAKPGVVSRNPGTPSRYWNNFQYLHCVSKYPCPLEEIDLKQVKNMNGLSDHTGHVLTGAVAVGAGAKVIEVHCKLHDTPKDNPDFPHSHFLTIPDPQNPTPFVRIGFLGNPGDSVHYDISDFAQYVANIRTAERMMA